MNTQGRFRRMGLPIVVAALLFVVLSGFPAFADTFSFNLGIGNSAISGYAGPYVSVQVVLTSSNTATITFTSLTNSGNTYLMGDGGTIGLNTNGAVTLGSITESNSGTGFSTGNPSHLPTSGGAGNEDGFGSFNLTVNNFDGFSYTADTVSVDLTLNSGTWASAADVLTANANGYFAAAHIFVTSDPANASNGALATGYAANGEAAVPEPATLLLVGSALAGLGAWTRRRRQASAASFAV